MKITPEELLEELALTPTPDIINKILDLPEPRFGTGWNEVKQALEILLKLLINKSTSTKDE